MTTSGLAVPRDCGDDRQRADICLAFAQRYSAAFVDLESRAALDAIA